MKLSIVICNYNTRDDLARCLESVEATKGDLTLEVIVVDNASRDGSAEMVRRDFPNVALVASSSNLWFNGGNNAGLRRARGEYIFILNPDTVLLPGTLHTLVNYLDAHADVGMVTCRMVFPDGAVQRNGSRFPSYSYLLLAHTFLGVLLPHRRSAAQREMWYAGWDRDSTRDVEIAPGSALMGRRELLARLGFFDESLKLFFSDDDLSQRVRAAGAAVRYVAEATLIHREHASVDQVKRLSTRIYFDDMVIFTRKYHGSFRAALLWLLLLPTRALMAMRASWRASDR